jgi:aryl-alcohol dehydrogenase-like predicted oxidoreductase
MDYISLGKSGLQVSSLCMGTMTFGSEANEAECGSLYTMCRDAGVNLFDCADVYAKGQSEQILGRLVRGHRDDVVLSTKAYFKMGSGPNDQGLGRKHLVNAITQSLRRLGTDYIDIFYLHKFDERTPLIETLETIDMLVKQGKVLYVGLSNFAAWQATAAVSLARLNALTRITCIQPMYNLLKRQCESEILPMAEHEGLGVIPYSPLAGGYLSGKYLGAAAINGRIVDNEMYKRRYADEDNPRVARLFTEYAADHGVHPVTLAIAWAASHSAVTAPLIGARTCEQLAPALLAASFTLSSSMRNEISAFSKTPQIATDRSEEN